MTFYELSGGEPPQESSKYMPLPDAPEQPASLRFFNSSPTGRWLNRQGSLKLS